MNLFYKCSVMYTLLPWGQISQCRFPHGTIFLFFSRKTRIVFSLLAAGGARKAWNPASATVFGRMSIFSSTKLLGRLERAWAWGMDMARGLAPSATIGWQLDSERSCWTDLGPVFTDGAFRVCSNSIGLELHCQTGVVFFSFVLIGPGDGANRLGLQRARRTGLAASLAQDDAELAVISIQALDENTRWIYLCAHRFWIWRDGLLATEPDANSHSVR